MAHNTMYNSEATFVDDTTLLTKTLIDSLERDIVNSNPHAPSPHKYILNSFNRGNDQINYGYTDKGLNLSNSKDAINFDELGTQLAYVYRFFASHVLIVGELLLSSSGLNSIKYLPKQAPVVQDRRSMNKFLDRVNCTQEVAVTCFGAGPGSEVAAIVSWLRTEGIRTNIRFHVVDKYLSWRDVAFRVGDFAATDIDFYTYDFLTADTSNIRNLVRDTDVICMSKFLSALTAHRARADVNLREVVKCMKPGAILVYFDNSGGGTTQWVTETATHAGLYEVFAVPYFNARVHRDCLSVNDRRNEFKVKVTDTLNVAMKIFMKSPDFSTLSNFNPGYQSDQFQPNFYRQKQYYRVGPTKIS